MTATFSPLTQSTFHDPPRSTIQLKTRYRSLQGPIPSTESLPLLDATDHYFPRVNCYQPPVVWKRAEGFQVYDHSDNCWIDFSSGAVMANTGHGHPRIRAALTEHLDQGLLAQFSFSSEIRIQLAERILSHTPDGLNKIYFLTTGSETTEAAIRLCRMWGMRQHSDKCKIVTFEGDYHGWTMGAQQVSGSSASKAWLPDPATDIYHLPFPGFPDSNETDGNALFQASLDHMKRLSICAEDIAAVFIETLQGWGALTFPDRYLHALRQWADQHQILLVFDEIQTGFGRTGKWFAHEHYNVRADLLCIGKGLTSSLPLAALLGPASILDLLSPAEVTTTHAGHPLSCAAALANLDILEEDNLIDQSLEKGKLATATLQQLQTRFPEHIASTKGLGLLQAIHVRNPATDTPDEELAWHWTAAAVRRGVMLFHTHRSTLKICPPLIIPEDALVEGIEALGEALDDYLHSK